MLTREESSNPSAGVVSAETLPAEHSRLERRIFLALGAIALIYAFLAAVATVADPDLGWHLATGRWVAQHHHVFTGDPFSYTVPGTPAIYPPFGGFILYGLYLLGGFKLLSWVSALACAGTIALLLRRGNAVTAAIAILAIPFIAYRCVPRPEIFAIVLFSAYLSLLWENYQTNKARLWLLPVLMLVWVNVHYSFFSGLGLMVAFGGTDILERPFADTRQQAVERLKREIPWFLATLLATLVNAWGWKIYPALFDYTNVLHTLHINEWAPAKWNWSNPFLTFSLRNTGDIFLVLVVLMALAIAVSFLQRRVGPAILLLAALYESSRHVRTIEMASCLAVVVGGSILYSVVTWIGSRIPSARTRLIAATVAAGIFALTAIVRTVDVVDNYHYVTEFNLPTFGPGLSPWYPRGGADFILDQNLPGEVLNTFNEGGYLVWRLFPRYRDYMDGRAVPFGEALAEHGGDLLTKPLDNPAWRQEADKYGVNTIIFPLTLNEISLDRLKYDCKSVEWRPVYLDEVSIVLVRRKPQTEDLIRRFEVNCATAPIPREPLPVSPATFISWTQSARVLLALGRNAEALAAIDNAVKIAPDNAHIHWYRGQILHAMQRNSDAEDEWKQAIALSPKEATPWDSTADLRGNVWYELADLYHHQERRADAIQALETTLQLSSDPTTKMQAMANLGALYMDTGKPAEAEKQWRAALELAPNDGLVWFSLGDLYQSQGHLPDAIHAIQQGVQNTTDPTTKANELVKLARLYFVTHQPNEALKALDDAASAAPPEMLADTKGRSFSFNIAQGRSAVYMALGDVKQATTYQEQAVQLDPDAPDAWAHLAKLYERQGRTADQQKAEERAKTLAANAPKY
jgi:tetratricopeptide (TPR) repeat protein